MIHRVKGRKKKSEREEDDLNFYLDHVMIDFDELYEALSKKNKTHATLKKENDLTYAVAHQK